MPITKGFLATKRQILVFRFFQAPESSTQHKQKNSVLLAVVDAYSERSQNMLAVAA